MKKCECVMMHLMGKRAAVSRIGLSLPVPHFQRNSMYTKPRRSTCRDGRSTMAHQGRDIARMMEMSRIRRSSRCSFTFGPPHSCGLHQDDPTSFDRACVERCPPGSPSRREMVPVPLHFTLQWRQKIWDQINAARQSYSGCGRLYEGNNLAGRLQQMAGMGGDAKVDPSVQQPAFGCCSR